MENVVADALTTAGHAVASFESVKNSETAIRAQLVGWIEDPDIDLVIIVGDGHNISKALAPLTDETLPGFADLLRMLAFQEIGASAMLSTAEAARCNTTFVFVLPLGEGAVRAAMDKLILPQLDPRTQPKNLISEMPRFREEGDFTRVDNDPVEDEGVPMAIVKEKTASGAGMIPRLPARAADPIPDPVRKRPSTQTRVKSATNKNVLVTKIEDPTKPIELQKLEKQIELSKVTGDSTKPMDLSRLPKLPPGASREQLPPEVEELTVRAPKVSEPKINEAITKITPAESSPAERPQSAPIGRPKPRTPVAAIPKIDKPQVKISSATPAAPLPVVKKPAIIVEDASEAQETFERPAVKIPPKIATEEIEPLEAEELVETIEHKPSPLGSGGAPAIVNLAALEEAADPAHSLQTSELEPLTEAEERETLERLLPVEKPRRPPTQPPPEPKKRPPTQPPIELKVAAKRSPTTPPPIAVDIASRPLQNSVELPAGNFDYKVKKSKLPLIIALLLIAGLAVGGVVLFTGRNGSETPKDAAMVAVDPPPPVDAAEQVTPDAPDEIEMEPLTTDAGKPRRPTNPTTPTRPNPTPRDAGTAVVRPEATPDAKVEVKPPDPPDGECDEASCVIEKYARPCCAKYKPPDDGFKPGNNDSLEKAQIRTGIERMKPAISRCGETNPGKGTVKVSVSVNPEGLVTSADVVESPSPELGKCVAALVRKATFAKTVNGGSFSYPFGF